MEAMSPGIGTLQGRQYYVAVVEEIWWYVIDICKCRP